MNPSKKKTGPIPVARDGAPGCSALERAAAILTQVRRCTPYDGLGAWPTRLRLAAAEGLHPDTVQRRCTKWGVPTRTVITPQHRARVEVDLTAYRAAAERRVVR